MGEYNKQIKQGRNEFESIPGLLDGKEIEELEFSPHTEDRKPWWERFYLQGDPFPGKDGLSAISADLYDAIIIKTELFQREPFEKRHQRSV